MSDLHLLPVRGLDRIIQLCALVAPIRVIDTTGAGMSHTGIRR